MITQLNFALWVFCASVSSLIVFALGHPMYLGTVAGLALGSGTTVYQTLKAMRGNHA